MQSVSMSLIASSVAELCLFSVVEFRLFWKSTDDQHPPVDPKYPEARRPRF
jgi:hypothetical protein